MDVPERHLYWEKNINLPKCLNVIEGEADDEEFPDWYRDQISENYDYLLKQLSKRTKVVSSISSALRNLELTPQSHLVITFSYKYSKAIAALGKTLTENTDCSHLLVIDDTTDLDLRKDIENVCEDISLALPTQFVHIDRLKRYEGDGHDIYYHGVNLTIVSVCLLEWLKVTKTHVASVTFIDHDMYAVKFHTFNTEKIECAVGLKDDERDPDYPFPGLTTFPGSKFESLPALNWLYTRFRFEGRLIELDTGGSSWRILEGGDFVKVDRVRKQDDLGTFEEVGDFIHLTNLSNWSGDGDIISKLSRIERIREV